MLARFVVNSHVKHHPNAVNSDDENEDEEAERVCQNLVPFYCDEAFQQPHSFSIEPFSNCFQLNRELNQATFLNLGQKLEVNVSHARTLVSPTFFKGIASASEKILNNIIVAV